jgi:uncharacterized membrane protein
MIQPEYLLQACATMIVGILFVATIWEIKGAKFFSTRMLWFCLWGVIPFSLGAILSLLNLTQYAIWICIFGFASFAIWLTVLFFSWSRKE